MEKKRKRQQNLILAQVFLSLIILFIYSAKGPKTFPHILAPGYFPVTLAMLLLFVFPPLVNTKIGKKTAISHTFIYICAAFGLFLLCLALFVW
jgi:Ca2+/Na+ antiporter